MLDLFVIWAEGSGLAQAVAQSAILTGLLSGTHLVGLTLVVGGALVSSLRCVGVLFPDRSVREIVRPIVSGITLGLGISIATGLLLVAPRLSTALANRIFQVKMLLLVVAAAFHFAVYHRVGRGGDAGLGTLRAIGVTELALWLGVALAGCAFILLE